MKLSRVYDKKENNEQERNSRANSNFEYTGNSRARSVTSSTMVLGHKYSENFNSINLEEKP